MWRDFCGIMLLPHNIVMGLNNVMKHYKLNNKHNWENIHDPLDDYINLDIMNG